MMNQQIQTRQLAHPRYDDVWFERLFQVLDRLHDDACAGHLNSGLAPEDVIGWLQDIIYTAQETIVEVRANRPSVTEAK